MANQRDVARTVWHNHRLLSPSVQSSDRPRFQGG
jgi:hypothetical protein